MRSKSKSPSPNRGDATVVNARRTRRTKKTRRTKNIVAKAQKTSDAHKTTTSNAGETEAVGDEDVPTSSARTNPREEES